MSVDEQQPGRFSEITHRGNSAEQDSAVAAVEDRETVLLQRRAHARVDSLHHFQQSTFIQEPCQKPAARIGL